MSTFFKEVTLGEVCLVGDGAHSKVTRTQSGIMYLTSKNIGQGFLKLDKIDYITIDSFDKLFPKSSNAIKRPQAGDILFGIIGTFGNLYLYKENDLFGFSSSIGILRPNKEKISSEYLYHVMNGEDFKNNHSALNAGSVQGYTNIATVKSLRIPLPSLNVQKNIAKILTNFDKKIHLNNQINQTLESIAQALFKSWFIDFDPVRAKITAKQQGKDSELAAMCAISSKSEAELKQMSEEDFAELQATAALFPAELMESELGKVPNGWLPVNIEYFIELIYGKALKKTERIHGVYPVYGSGGLTGWHNKALVKGPGVIIGRKGTIGSIFLENKDFYPIDTTYYVKTKNNCSLLFAYYLLQTLGLEKMNTDAAVPGLNRQNFYHLEVPFYSSDLIEKYTKTIENIISKNLSIKKENEYLIGMRDSLLPKLLSGEVALGDVIDG